MSTVYPTAPIAPTSHLALHACQDTTYPEPTPVFSPLFVLLPKSVSKVAASQLAPMEHINNLSLATEFAILEHITTKDYVTTKTALIDYIVLSSHVL